MTYLETAAYDYDCTSVTVTRLLSIDPRVQAEIEIGNVRAKE